MDLLIEREKGRVLMGCRTPRYCNQIPVGQHVLLSSTYCGGRHHVNEMRWLCLTGTKKLIR